MITAFVACAPMQEEVKNEFRISGQISGLDVNQGKMTIQDSTAKRGFRVDSVMFDLNGHLDYTVEISEPTVLRISFWSDKLIKWVGHGEKCWYIPTRSSLLMFVAYSGADIKTSGEATDFCDAYLSGDEENELLAKMNKSVYTVMNNMVNLSL